MPESVEADRELRVHVLPRRSVMDNIGLDGQLSQDDVDAGHAFVLPRGEAKACEMGSPCACRQIRSGAISGKQAAVDW